MEKILQEYWAFKLLSQELSRLSFSEIGKRYKIVSYKTASSSDSRLKELLTKNVKLNQQYAKIKERCSQGGGQFSFCFCL